MSAPIVLVPGYWLGAWAWDEVAAALRADGHEVMALTLPGLESVDTDRSSITFADHVDAICDAVAAAGPSGGACRAQRLRHPRLRRHRPHPGADRPHGLRRHRSRQGRARPRGGAPGPAHAVARSPRRVREPQRAQSRAAGDVPATGRARAGRCRPRGGGADQRRPPRCAEHGHRDRVPLGAVQGGRQRGLCLPGRADRAPQRDLRRPADQPLADVVATPGARRASSATSHALPPAERHRSRAR